jgi:hypothetical protein
MPDHTAALRKLALRHAGVEEGIACPGTAMERHTMKAGKKAFLFFGSGDALVKLEASLAEAKKLAKAEPKRYRAGANGWVKLMFTADEPPKLDVLARWIAESHALVAAPAKKKPAKKKK